MASYDRKLQELKKTLQQASNLRQLDIGISVCVELPNITSRKSTELERETTPASKPCFGNLNSAQESEFFRRFERAE